MKGDFTHSTFEPKKHYDRVLEQQGRVTLDSDFNEQADLVTYRLESTTADEIGPSGAPMANAGFAITDPAALTTAQKTALQQLGLAPAAKGDLMIGAGHYYVDGILVENDQLVPYSKQPHLPGLSTAQADGDYIVYLDVWKRHITALEDPEIRETALGGPDTATRSQVIWQVKLYKLAAADAAANCDTKVNAFDQAIAASTSTLAARAQQTTKSEPCVLPPTAGYRRLENQLYRVEIHDASVPAQVTFKWSRENGAVVSSGEFINNLNDRMKLTQPGRDALRGFATGDWVELTTDALELNFKPGIMVQLKKVDGSEALFDLTTASSPINVADFPKGAKVRRWDSPGLIRLSSADPTVDDGYLRLEDGIQVKFTGTAFHNGDYWTIPGRTGIADILWPRVTQGATVTPLSLPPQGIRHHYSRLALAHFQAGVVTAIRDCRHLFPPLTGLTSFFYISGDGQMATPNVSTPTALLPLLRPLQAGVANGSKPVPGATVEFTVKLGQGRVNGATSVRITTDNLGVAACNWTVDSSTAAQEVEARLIDGNSQPVHLPVRYEATLDTAARVSYDPKACSNLAGLYTVQDALDRLCRLGHGGCCVTVGEGGEYPTLEAALDALKDEQSICLCLLAGPHLIEKPIEFSPTKPGVTVHIRGCGAATQVQGGKGARLIFKGAKEPIEEVRLEDFHLLLPDGILAFINVADASCTNLRFASATEAPLRFEDVASATIDNCAVSNGAPTIALLCLNVPRLRVWHSLISGLSNRQQAIVVVQRAQEVTFEHNTIDVAVPVQGDMSPKFDADAQRFVAEFSALRFDDLLPFAAAWARSIPADQAGRDAYARLLIAAAVSTAVRLTDGERYYYNAAGAFIQRAAPDAAGLLPYLKGLRIAAQVQNRLIALSIDTVASRLEMTGNQVDGVTVLYGTYPYQVTEQDVTTAGKTILKKFSMNWPVRDAVFQGNEFGLMTVDGAYWKAVLAEQALPPETFRNLAFTNNRLHGAPHLVVGGYLAFSGNFFLMYPGFNGGSISAAAAFATNQAQAYEDNYRFLSAALKNQTSAYLRDANQMFIVPV